MQSMVEYAGVDKIFNCLSTKDLLPEFYEDNLSYIYLLSRNGFNPLGQNREPQAKRSLYLY